LLTVEEIPFLAMPIHVVTELSIEPHGTTRTLQRLADSSQVNTQRLSPLVFWRSQRLPEPGTRQSG
jgi:hypothetical protein